MNKTAKKHLFENSENLGMKLKINWANIKLEYFQHRTLKATHSDW